MRYSATLAIFLDASYAYRWRRIWIESARTRDPKLTHVQDTPVTLMSSTGASAVFLFEDIDIPSFCGTDSLEPRLSCTWLRETKPHWPCTLSLTWEPIFVSNNRIPWIRFLLGADKSSVWNTGGSSAGREIGIQKYLAVKQLYYFAANLQLSKFQ